MESIFIEIGPANFLASWIVGGVCLALAVLFLVLLYALDDDVFFGPMIVAFFAGIGGVLLVSAGIAGADTDNKETQASAAVDALGVDRLAEDGLIRLKDGSLCSYSWAGVEGGIEVSFIC